MAFILLQDSADSGDVLDGKPEHDQGHGGLANIVELFQVVLHDHCELFQVGDFVIDFGVTVWLKEISKEEVTDIIVRNFSSG